MESATNRWLLVNLIHILVDFVWLVDFNKTLLCNIDCYEDAAGLCVESDGRASSLPLIMSTFGSYWEYCRNHSTYIVGNTSRTSCQWDIVIWTGLRKYNVDNSNIDIGNNFIFGIQNGTVNHNRRNCKEYNFFFSLSKTSVHC